MMLFSLFVLTVLIGSSADPIKDIHNNEMPVPYNFGIYPISPSSLRLIWDAPEVDEDNIIYYVNVAEMNEPAMEEDFCSQIMPGAENTDGNTEKPRVTLSDGKSVPTPQADRLSCTAIPARTQVRGPKGREETCYTIKGSTQLIVTGLSSYEQYRAKIQACYDTILGLCSDTVSVIGRTLPEDPLNKIARPQFVGEEPTNTPGTVVKLKWELPPDDRIRAFSVVLRINDRKAVMLCRSHADILRRNLTFEVLTVGPGHCHITARAATHAGWHDWHDIGQFIPRMAKGKLDNKNNAMYKESDVLDGREVALPETDPAEMQRMVSFMSPEAHVVTSPILLGRIYDVRIQVKTLAEDGLIMYTANNDQSDVFSVSMVGGKFVVVVDAGGGKIVLISSYIYNDGEWHNLLFRQQGSRLTLQIDGADEVRNRHYSRKTKISSHSPLFFGGIPANYKILPANVGTSIGFMGCIKDVFIKDRILDFTKALPQSHSNMSMTGCLLTQQMTSESEYIMSPAVPSRAQNGHTSAVSSKTNTQTQDMDNDIGVNKKETTHYECSLPLRPISIQPVGVVISSSVKFGEHAHSRYEYASLPGSFRQKSDFVVDFKTFSPTGLIFYAADLRLVDSVAVFLLNGKVHYMYNCGSGPARLTSSKNYNDGQWHTLNFWRNGNEGKLTMDSVDVVWGSSPGLTKTILVSPPYFLGGIPETGPTLKHHEQERVTSSFDGCLRNFKHNGRELGPPDKKFQTTSCSPNVMENGTYFLAEGAYIKMYNSFDVGFSLIVSVEVKPRSLNGVLLSVKSEISDSFVLKLENGKVVFTVDNGAGPFTAIFTPRDGHNLCDGRWHRIEATKNKNVLLLGMDGKMARPAIGPSANPSTDTDSPMYIGGVPKHQFYAEYEFTDQYVGCMRNFRLNGTHVNLARSVTHEGKLQMHSCPVD